MKPDLLEIINVQAAYSYTHDHGLHSEFAALFAEDAVFSRPGKDDLVGGQALDAFARESGKAGVHTSGAPYVLDDGSVRTPFVFVGATSGRVSSGYYEDTFTKSSTGALLFQRRAVEPIASLQAAS